MITIIHGDDVVASRKFFIEQKNSSENQITLDNNNFNLTEFLQSLSGKSLFAETKNIFLDGIFSSKKISDEQIETIISTINKFRSPIDFFIWEGNELSKTFLNQFPKATNKFLKLPQSLFIFLDNIKPNNPQNISLFHDALNNSDENFLFAMLIRQFRLLIAISSNSEVDETKKLAPWQRGKLERQAKMFTNKQLKEIYNKLYEIDLNIKTGVYSNLGRTIDFLLLDI